MRLEQTIRDQIISEAADLGGRLDQLVRAGLMPSNVLPVLHRAIAKVQNGMTLQGSERDAMNMFINSMMFIVLGDDTVFHKARAGAKTYATEAKEKQEYDYEGDMAMSQLKSIIANSQRMHDMLSDDTNLPEWVQSKITLAEDYISTAANYMQGEMNEEVELEEGITSMSDARLKFHATKKFPHGSYTSKEIKAEHERRRKTVPNYHTVKASLGEEAEQIDEISKKTLASYSDKAVRQTYGNQPHGKDALRKRTNREQGVKAAYNKFFGYKTKVPATEEVEQVDEIAPVVAAAGGAIVRSLAVRTAARAGAGAVGRAVAGAAGEAVGSSAGSALAKKVSGSKTNEGVQIDELSKETLGRYVKKSAERMSTQGVVAGLKIAKDEKSQKNFDTISKRSRGISTAVKKLTKENIEAVKSMNESYKIAFDSALNHYNIKSPSELGEEQRKEFFNFVDQEFKKGDN